MNDGLAFLLGFFITLSVAFSVVRYMSRHLKRMLLELCGSEGRAEFWAVFANISVIFVPAIIALNKIPDATSQIPLLVSVTNQLKWSMSALILSVLVIGFVLSKLNSDGQRQKIVRLQSERRFSHLQGTERPQRGHTQ